MNFACAVESEKRLTAALVSHLPQALIAKAERLLAAIRERGSLIVAYSGGVDSSLVAFCAREMLGDQAVIAIAVSPSLASSELEDARRQSRHLGFDLVEINTEEVDKEEYRQNTGNRCFFCKSTLFEHLEKLRSERAVAAIAYGANMDDLSDTRPGHAAARNFNVAAPLVEAGLFKTEIRALARAWGLSSWDRPQAACLSSRFPDFVYITPQRLNVVESAEDLVRARGFRQVRVRFRQESELSPLTSAVVEVGEDELTQLLSNKHLMDILSSEIAALGFDQVLFDPTGYRQGKANALPSGGAGG